MDFTFDDYDIPAITPTRRLSQNGLPNLILTQGKNPRPAVGQQLTLENLRYVMDGMGYSVRMNMMKGDIDLIDPEGKVLEQIAFENGITNIENQCVVLGMHNTNRLMSFMANLAEEDAYHPMLEWIESADWDGDDRISTLAATLPVMPESEAIRNIYVRKWVLQAVEAVASWRDKPGKPISLPHVLVLAGGQGLGKTSWFRRLGADKFLATECELHLSSSMSKDHQLAVLKNPMAELSEIDSTFRKSDVASLKSFISRPEDTIRAPYAARAVTRRRGTVFCGSVNNADFLVDSTGSRRFWPIEVIDTIDYEHGIEMQQLWAQAYAEWKEGAQWTLTEEEDRLRVADAERFTAAYPEEEALEAQFGEHGGSWPHYIAMPIFGIMKTLGVHNNPMSKSRARDWLIKNLGKSRRIHGRKNCWAIPVDGREAMDSKFGLSPSEAFEYMKDTKAFDLIPEDRRAKPATSVGQGENNKVSELFKK